MDSLHQQVCTSISDADRQALIECPMRVPRCAKDIEDSIVFYGEFYEAFEYMLRTFRSKTPAFIILRGSSGCGKKTLIQQAQLYLFVGIVYLEFDDHTSEQEYLFQVAQKLKWESSSENDTQGATIEDLLKILEATRKKFVIVLPNFEKFCCHNQSLLYSLANLSRQRCNISIVGLTCRFDCANNLKKPAKSHLNAVFYELIPPYKSKQEYVEFASLLLGRDLSTVPRVKKSLERIYINTKSMRDLKSYLISICSWNNKKELMINSTKGSTMVPGCGLTYLERCLASLSRLQQKMLKTAVSYCNALETCTFTLWDLEVNPPPLEGYHVLERKHKQILEDAKTLVSMGLFIPPTILSCDQVKLGNKQPKSSDHQEISLETEFTIGVPPLEMRVVNEWDSKNSAPHKKKLWNRRRI